MPNQNYNRTEFGDGDERYYLDDEYHRLDGPALITAEGARYWYRHGLLHREDGPAVISAYSDKKEWCIDGKRHNLNGPAVIWGDGSKEYWVHGMKHKLKGPAATYMDTNGEIENQQWYKKGLHHRLDGPANERKNKAQDSYYINGIRYMSIREWKKKATSIISAWKCDRGI